MLDYGEWPGMREAVQATGENPVLRYLAIMRAARDFGLSRAELERVAQRFHPLDVSPRALADALADALLGHGVRR